MPDNINKNPFLLKDTFYRKMDILVSQEGATEQEAISYLKDNYEIEGVNSEFSFLETMKNAPASLGNFGVALYKAATSPLETTIAIRDVAAGFLSKAGIKERGEVGEAFDIRSEKAADAAIDFFADRYGGVDRMLNTIEKDPFGFLGDIASVTNAGGALITKSGQVSKIGSMERLGGALSRSSRFLEPVEIISGIVRKTSGATKKTIQALSRNTGLGENLKRHAGEFVQKATGLSKAKSADLAQKTFGKPIGDVLAEWGVFGTYDEMANQLENVAKISKKTVDENLAQVTQKFTTPAIGHAIDDLEKVFRNVRSEKLKDIKKTIGDFKKKFEGEEVSGAVDTGFTQTILSGEVLPVAIAEKGLTLTELNQLKRFVDKFDSSFKETGQITGIGTVDFAKAGIDADDIINIRNSIQGLIEKEAKKAGFGNIKELNKQTMFSTRVQKALKDASLSMKDRVPFIDEFTGSLFGKGGIVAAIAYADPTPLFAAAGLVGLQRYLKKPEFVTGLANKLMTLADSDFRSFQQAFKTGKMTPKAKGVIRRTFKEVQKAFPELRLLGEIKEEVENIERPTFNTTVQDVLRIQ